MPQEIALVLAVLLAGAAAAGLVSGPPGRLKRLAPTGHLGQSVRKSTGLDVLPTARPDAIPVGQRWTAGLAAGAVTALVARTMGFGSATVTGAVGVLAAGSMIIVLGQLESAAARQRRLQMITDLPHVLELLAAAMRAGLPLRGAVREVTEVADGPLAADLGGLLKSIDLGQNDADAWRELRDHPALGRAAIDLARSVDSGTMVTDTLRRHARVARRDRRATFEARAKTVGVKTVPALMLCLVPSFLLISIVPSAVTAFQGLIF